MANFFYILCQVLESLNNFCALQVLRAFFVHYSCITDYAFFFFFFFLSLAELKHALISECRAWKSIFGHNVNVKYRTMMDELLNSLDDIAKRLGRPINDLDDVRTAMSALKEMREEEIRIDMSIGPVEVSAITKCEKWSKESVVVAWWKENHWWWENEKDERVAFSKKKIKPSPTK